MSILDNIFNRFGFVSQAQLQNQISEAVKRELEKVELWQAETAAVQKWTLPAPEIFANQADLYRLSPTLGTAIDILANDIGTAKFNVKRLRGEEEIDIPNHEFEDTLRVPNPIDSGIELMQYTTSNYKLNGNSIWWINRKDQFSKVDEIWTIPFSMIKPVPDGRFYLSHYEYFPGNARSPIRFETWEITHLKTYNPNHRYVGLSPLESLIETITGDLAMRHSNTSDYQNNNGAPPSILAFKDFVPNEQWTDIKAETRGAAKRNEMMMLRGTGDAVTWLARAISKKDQEFIANLKQNMTDIFNRMCPGLLSMLSENATEANALAARATYSEKTLWPMMEVIAQKITSDILTAYGIKLRGHFDDPRVVDRKLKLEEQKEFSRSHTLAEVRKEYYQDDPLGDERDKELMLVAEKMQVKEEPPPPEPAIPVPNWPQGTPLPSDEQPAEEAPLEDTGAEDMSTKAVIDDLKRWRRMAIQGTERATKAEKAMSYTSDLIPVATIRTIKAKLTSILDKDAMAKMFDAHIDGMKPKPKMDGLQILKAIELGVQARESEERLAREQAERADLYASIKLMSQQRPPNIILPAPVINLPPSENNYHFSTPQQEPPNNYYNFSPNVEAAKPADVRVDSPVHIYNAATEPQEPPVTNLTIENKIPEQPAPITNVTVENTNQIPEQSAPTIKNEIILPESSAPAVTFAPVIQPSGVSVQVTNEVNPTPIENKVEVKTPKVKRTKSKVNHDSEDRLSGQTVDFEYEE